MPWRHTGALVIVLCCCVLLVCAPGCGRKQQSRMESVTRLLDEGKVDDALTQVRTLVEQGVVAASEAAAALVKWAGAPRNPDTAITVYFAALELAPDTAEAYIGLSRLREPAPSRLGYDVCERIIGYWRKGTALDAGLVKSDTASAAVSAIAGSGGEYQLAADLSPGNGEFQLAAALMFLQQEVTDKAAPYAERAVKLIGTRSDTSMLQATLGTLKPDEVTTVCAVPTAMSAGTVIGVDATHAYLLVPPIADTCRLVSVALATGEAETLVQSCADKAAVTRDGMWLAYATYSDWEQPCEIRVLNLSTRENTLVTGTRSGITGMNWSDDGTRLAVTSDEGLITVNRDGSSRQLLVATRGEQENIEIPKYPRWSPDGRRIAYCLGYWEGSGAASVIQSGGGDPVTSIDGSVYKVLWLDDNRIAFAEEAYGDFDGTVAVKEASAGTASPKQITNGHVDASLFTASPDGKRIMIGLSLRPTYEPLPEGRVWISDVSDGALHLLPMPDVTSDSVFWAPDGTIYYCTANRLVGFRLKN